MAEGATEKADEMRGDVRATHVSTSQPPVKVESLFENRRQEDEDLQPDALSLVMKEQTVRERDKKSWVRTLNAAEERLAEERKVLEPTAPLFTEVNAPTSCVIPLMPTGRHLELRILSTWGDDHYVGLSGIEIFDGKGDLLSFQDPTNNIRAEPSDINSLAGFGSDPRTVDNLLDGVNCTCDDLHQWLAPFRVGEANMIYIDLEATTTLSMVRVWNYNKSRIHAARGARNVEIFLDQTMLFMGEIRQAPGNLADAEENAEVLLFTQDPELLDAIATSMDKQRDLMGQINEEDEKPAEKRETQTERPSTPGDAQDKMMAKEEDRNKMYEQEDMATSGKKMSAVVSQIAISIIDTWGDTCYVGLTGVEIIAEDGTSIALNDSQVFANPRDLNDIPGSHQDPRTKDKLVDGHNVTTDDHHMWLIPFTPGASHLLQLDLGSPTSIAAVRLWNYNKNSEDATRGAKRLLLMLDGRLVSPDCGFVLRKAPGHAMFDFGQTITMEEALTQTRWSLPRTLNQQPKSLADSLARLHPSCDAPSLPRGLTLTIMLAASHGDLYYIGLNGIKIFDEHGGQVHVRPQQVVASPGSINELPEVRERGGGDCRTPDKLVDGFNDTWDAQHIWLAPLAREGGNRIFIIFDSPVTVSMLKIWNYSRTPSRGAAEIHIAMDGLYVHMGYLRPAPEAGHRAAGKSFVQSIPLGPCEESNVDRESIAAPQAEQHVVLVNERRVVGGSQVLQQERSSQPSSLQPSVPSSSSSAEPSRPTTSVPVRGSR